MEILKELSGKKFKSWIGFGGKYHYSDSEMKKNYFHLYDLYSKKV